jgi:sterol O-acyltransferase
MMRRLSTNVIAGGSDSGESTGETSQMVGRLAETGNASLSLSMEKALVRKSSDSDDTLLEELEGLVPAPSHSNGKNASDSSEDSRSKKLKNRPKSIKIHLEKTAKDGQYQLNLEDPELRSLLLQGFQTDKTGKITQKRSQFGATILKKQFTAFDRQHPDAELPSFHGFFSLFWMGVGLLLVRIAANNWRKSGSIFGENAILKLMFSQDVLLLGAIDCLMMSSAMLVSLFIQLLCVKNWISWGRSGWLIQNLWQTVFLGGFIAFCRIRWPDIWTHSVFITLHTITILMKQHSYAFYNGYLSEIYKKKHALERKLDLLEDAEIQSPLSPAASHATAYFDPIELSQLSHRRKTIHPNTPGDPDISRVASALASDEPLSSQQVKSLRKLISWEIENCTTELRGTCKTTQNYYPTNLTLTDAFSYLPLPTLLYELEYPRQPSISWWYVLEKTTATFGVLGVMIVVSEAQIYPTVMSILAMKASKIPLSSRLAEFPWAFSDLLFPFMLEYLLSWYVIWECVLNLLAELTCFEDRGFYNAWWNSTSWDQFARDWNAPVHAFLLRFAYQSSRSSWRLSKGTATLVTFLISACVHELVMAVIFGKIRGYLLMLQMAQLPLVMLSRTRFLRGRDVLGNLVFWLGIFVGPSFLCSLYLFL